MASEPETSVMDTDQVIPKGAIKRSITVDPDSNEIIQESKKPKIELDLNKKEKCITLLVRGFEKILSCYFPDLVGKDKKAVRSPDYNIAYFNLPISIQIANIIFTLHTYKRQIAAGKKDTNVIKKSEKTEFTITLMGKSHIKKRDVLLKIWSSLTDELELVYKNYGRDEQAENWYGTFGPYIDFCCGFGLRMKELRLGHDKMPISKKDDVMQEVPVKKYGLNGAHHILLEGSTFPPEKRSSMAQSMGPMTAYLCMIRSEGIYRDKWAAAVKRAFNHVPIIDDIIEVTKGQRKASDVSIMTGLLAEICLITTSRQATRAFFPLAMIHRAAAEHSANMKEYCEFFNTTGSGAFYTYKLACDQPWTLTGSMKEEVASQIVFHSIFGTFKEDLSILSEITNVSTWFTREEFGKCFRKGDKADTLVRANLPILRYYAKMSCANQSGLLTGVYNQVSSIPCFSGKRVQKFGSDFFEHIERKMVVGSTGKSISQIVSSLSIILDDLRKRVNESQGNLEMGTTEWRNMSDLALGQPGAEIKQVISGKGIYFMGKPASRKM